MWLLVGLAVALFGVVARACGLVWVVLAYGGIVGYFGDMFGFPDWAINLSRYGHTPLLPAEAFTAVPILIMTLITASLIAARLAGFRRRDLASTA